MAKQRKPKKSLRSAIDDIRFWKRRLFHPSYTRNGKQIRQPELAVRLQKAGVRHTFKLNTANQDKAARKAVQIYALLLAVDWPETLKRFGVEKPSTATHARKVTIGQYLAAAEAVFDRKPKTFRLYAIYLRRIVSEYFGITAVKRDGIIAPAGETVGSRKSTRFDWLQSRQRNSRPGALDSSTVRATPLYVHQRPARANFTCGAQDLFSAGRLPGSCPKSLLYPSRCRSMALTSSGRDRRNTKVKLTCRC